MGRQAGCPVVAFFPCRRSWRRTEDDTLWHLAHRDEAPEGDEQLARQRHDHRLACAAASIGRSRLKPLGQDAVLLEPEKTPSQLDHAAPDAGVTGARKTPLAPASAAFVRRAGETGVAGDGLVITQAAREDLIDQHVCRLDANAEDPRNETYHRVRTDLASRDRRKLAQASLLDRADLLARDA